MISNDIDECIFASYNSLDLNTLQKFFYFNTREQLLDYIHTHHVYYNSFLSILLEGMDHSRGSGPFCEADNDPVSLSCR